jgi:hypothetical protein
MDEDHTSSTDNQHMDIYNLEHDHDVVHIHYVDYNIPPSCAHSRKSIAWLEMP